MLETRKVPRRSLSMYDRVNKSDGEDKSLSNDEIPLPSCPRQPPDGVETPFDAVEKVPDLPTRLPPRLPVQWSTTRSRYSYSSRTQDARSEASVKDKIAMFSNETSTDQVDKCGTLPNRNATLGRKSTTNYTTSFSDISTLDKRLTKSQDNLDEVLGSKKYKERPEVMGAIDSSNTIINNTSPLRNSRLQIENKPLFYGSTNTLSPRTETTVLQTAYHTRSISDDNSNKTNYKSNLEYLIEQRKKSMSKLRGLVIPEVQGPVVGLPEIKVHDTLPKTFAIKPFKDNNTTKETKARNVKVNLNENKWKANLLPNNLPKYSPAFKRKSLQVYTPSSTSISKESTPERKFNEKIHTFNNNKLPLTQVPMKGSSLPKHTYDYTPVSNINGRHSISNSVPLSKDLRNYKNVEIKIATATDILDSDNDSAMSSTQSSYRSSASSPLHTLDSIESDSSHLSPKITSHFATYSIVKTESPKTSIIGKNIDEYGKRNICRSVSSDTNVSLSSSAGSAATSGSQASCSSLESSIADSDKKKNSKTYNIDTLNRRNILASAKCRSGRDTKLTSPVVETKFSHDNRSPSPVKKSERLSTLTPNVSAISNKGDNRRRNKVIADTDSDSDSEINVRQRKTDYKNTRLKRNSSSCKNKQNEYQIESTKIEEQSMIVSEKVIKDIKKNVIEDNNIIQESPKLSDKSDLAVYKVDTKLSTNKNYSAELDTSKKDIVVKSDNFKALESPKIKKDVKSENKISTHFVRLKRGAGTGVGLILAGGIDCEAKYVTVHRVLADSIAAKAGILRGDRIRSINGFNMTGLTHAETVAILKEQRAEVVIEIEDEIQENVTHTKCDSEKAESKDRNKSNQKINGEMENAKGGSVTVLLEKAGGGAGLGFGLDGGRDSPQGDKPLTIKKLFAGGAAAQSGRIIVGAELLAAGGQSMEGFTRTQAWAALKALPPGPVTLVLRNP